MSASRIAKPSSGGDLALRVLVVDDHDVVQWGFRLLLERQTWVERCAAATSSTEALELVSRLKPHVALVDLFLGSQSGAELTQELLARSPRTRVLLISGAGSVSRPSRPPPAPRGSSPRLGALPMSSRRSAWSLSWGGLRQRCRRRPGAIDSREREVLAEVAAGSTNREIGAELHLSPHTIKEHTSSIYHKLEVRNRAEAVQHAQCLGLIG